MKTNGPFVINESNVKYKNNWIEVVEDKVTRPNGQPGLFGIVNYISGVAVLPLDEEGFVYLTEEFHYALEAADIEAVSGGIDPGEEPSAAAKRELKEELGIEATEWIDLGTVNPFTTVIKSPQRMYLAKQLTFGESHQEETEDIKLVKIKFEEAVKMAMDSKITHGPSALLILKAKNYLGV
jgi:ADP-ribose pyrophosphatase